MENGPGDFPRRIHFALMENVSGDSRSAYRTGPYRNPCDGRRTRIRQLHFPSRLLPKRPIGTTTPN